MLCGLKGNRTFGIALAMHHRLTGLFTHGLNGHDQVLSTRLHPGGKASVTSLLDRSYDKAVYFRSWAPFCFCSL